MAGSVGYRGGLGAARAGLLRGAASLVCIAGVACSAGAETGIRVTLEVKDGWIREPGAECAGSRPFLYVHRDATFRVEQNPDGEVVAEGVLPGGRAVEATREELGVPRVPTSCRFRFDVSLPGEGDYRLVLEEGSPLGFSADEGSGDVTLVVP